MTDTAQWLWCSTLLNSLRKSPVVGVLLVATACLWAQVLLEKIEHGEGEPEDINQLEELCRFAAPGNTFCALAPGAVEPLQSALKYFREDFEAHINQACCPFHDKKRQGIDETGTPCIKGSGGDKYEQL